MRALRSFAPVHRSEIESVALLASNVFVLMTTYYVLKVVREPLILLDRGAEVKAYASAGQAGLLMFVVPAFGALAARRSRLQLMVSVQAFFIGCLVAFYALARPRAGSSRGRRARVRDRQPRDHARLVRARCPHRAAARRARRREHAMRIASVSYLIYHALDARASGHRTHTPTTPTWFGARVSAFSILGML